MATQRHRRHQRGNQRQSAAKFALEVWNISFVCVTSSRTVFWTAALYLLVRPQLGGRGKCSVYLIHLMQIYVL